MTDQWAVYLYR